MTKTKAAFAPLPCKAASDGLKPVNKADSREELKMLMTDKNGKQIKHGDMVKIEGGFFKADNGLFRVEHAPGDENWLGNDYCLKRVKKDGTQSTGKYTTAFWPLMVTVNSYEKRIQAREHNANFATIEVISEEIQEVAHITEVLPEVNEVPGVEEITEVSQVDFAEVQPEPEEIRPLNSYEQKLEDRRQRYLDRAASKRSESNSVYNQARKMASVIPFGQPIASNSNRQRDINYRNKISNKYEKSFKLSDTANYYEQKAATVGNGGISSDDPDAIIKLKAQLEQAEKSQEIMKAANKAIRSKNDEALRKLGLTDSQIAKLKAPDFMGRIGFPSYALTKNNANIHRLRQRIEELSNKAANNNPVEVEHDGYTYKEDDNRIQFIFPGKPADEVRNILKQYSFKWSPTRKAWVRMLNGNGKYAAECVTKKLAEVL